MKLTLTITYRDVKDCFLRVPSLAAKDEEFVKVEYGSTGTSYFSVARGQAGSVDCWKGAVGLNASYAKSLGLGENEVVSVTFLKSLPKLTAVNCLHDSDDLDVLELSRDRLEEKILQQIKVVWPGQTFPIWVGKNFSCDIQVEYLSPPCSVGILWDGTVLNLRPRPTVGNASQRKNPKTESPNVGLEFRACQMPSFLCTKLGDAGVSMQDWLDSWPVKGLWCHVSCPGASNGVDTYVVPSEGNIKTLIKLAVPNILLSKHVRTELGLKGNGQRVKVTQSSSPAPVTPSLPSMTVADAASSLLCELDDDCGTVAWKPLMIGPIQQIMVEGLASLELGLRLSPLADLFNPLCQPRLSHNVLIFGPRGSGRSTLAREMGSQLSGAPHFVHLSTISCRGLVGKRPDVCGKILKESVEECIACQPSILLLDDLDCLAPRVKSSEENTPEGIHSNRIGELVSRVIMSTVHADSSDRVVFIATALSPANLSSLLVSPRGTHIFTSVLAVPELDDELREKMLETMLRGLGGNGDLGNESGMKTLKDISLRTAGFVAVDLADLLERAKFDALRRTAICKGKDAEISNQSLESNPDEILPEDLESALSRTSPISLHGMQLDGGERPGSGGETLWLGVGGLCDAKKKLEEMVLWPLKYHQLFCNLPLKPRRGLLLYGPPGVGKTRLVSSLAGHCGLRLINVKGPELLSKYIGASEEAVRNIFQKASSARPSVLFFDEFESLAPRRGHDSTGVTDRVVNQLLTQLDGVEESTSGVFIVAATTRPDLVDPALLRPGRLDTPVLCPMPQLDDRESILKELGRQLPFDEDVDLHELAKLTPGFSGADLQAVLYTSQIMALKSAKIDCMHGEPLDEVKWADVLEALKQTKPSLTAAEIDKYERRYAAANGYSTAESSTLGVKVCLV
ncbi:peroxisome biogenesis factor 1-like [Ischnura elegans]|uniref:peroxisome biogenesis factor 1-like n=1 Tax=Ischnura elegans TaxID=197161 RepID=UPI001ED8ADFC|nr:peroxisome biogenesis factor 1-like [Ischnura elegans]